MMNKQGPEKIDWTDYTWNPISGCEHDCWYCYMKRLEKRFPGTMEPNFRSGILADPQKKKQPVKIFVGSSGDMFGDWVPNKWIHEVLHACYKSEIHTFQFLTKNPVKYSGFYLPENGWYGTTIDGSKKTENNLDLLLYSTSDRLRFISFEPLLKRIDVDLTGIGWIIIGANSNPGSKKPPHEWADSLIEQARNFNIPVWMKDNYGYPERVKEFPLEVR